MKTKTCTKCKRELPATTEYFYRQKRNTDGLKSWCKKCHYKITKKYRRSGKGKIIRKKINRKNRHTISTHLRNIFSNIKRRCNTPSCKAYKNYGGRGIKNKFKSSDEFVDYVVNELSYDTYEKVKGLEIDRIDNDGHYQKGNIRFVTHSENNKNKRDSRGL